MKKKLIVILTIVAVIAAAVIGVVPALADTPGPLHHIAITPSAPTVAAGATQQFTAQAYDTSNVAISGLTYTWSITAGGLISTTGLFTAGTTAGTFNSVIQVSATQGSVTVTATASVVVTAADAPPEFTSSLNVKKIMGLFEGFFGKNGFANFQGGQWTVKEGTATNTYKAIPGAVQTASATSITIIPNGLAAPVTFSLAGVTVLPKGATFAANDNAVVVTVNDVPKYVLKIQAPAAKSGDDGKGNEPPGLRKHEGSQGPKSTPPGWDKGKKTGWHKQAGVSTKNQTE